MEGDQRIDLRDKIFREVIGNIICHREYTDGTATELLIEDDAVRTLNPTNPYFHGIMDLNNFNPHPKNPNIRKFFTALGWADEIGSGIRNTQKYLPRYVEKAAPVFIDEPLFRTIIPLVRYTMSDFKLEWFDWLESDEKWLLKLTESLKNIEIDERLQKMSWEEQISYLVPSWIEKVTKFVPSASKKVTKSQKINMSDDKVFERNDSPSSTEKLIKFVLSPLKISTKLPDKKLQYLIKILFFSGLSITKDELIDLFQYRNVGFFRQNYLKPLETAGFIQKNQPRQANSFQSKVLDYGERQTIFNRKRFLRAMRDNYLFNKLYNQKMI
jgi:ATP-dependent DNA helicase RecG